MAKSSSVVLRTSFNCLWRCLLWQHLPGLYSLLSWDKTYIFGALTCPGCLEVENCPRDDKLHPLHQTCVQIGLNQLLLMFTWHLAPAHCSWETCSIHRSRCGTRSLDKVGHIGNLLPLFSPDFAKICPKSRPTMRRYVIAAGNFRTSKAISLTVCVIYETIDCLTCLKLFSASWCII